MTCFQNSLCIFYRYLCNGNRRNSYENDNGNSNDNDNNNDANDVDNDNNDNDDEDDDVKVSVKVNFDMELSLPMIEKMTTNRGQVIQKEQTWPSPQPSNLRRT